MNEAAVERVATPKLNQIKRGTTHQTFEKGSAIPTKPETPTARSTLH